MEWTEEAIVQLHALWAEGHSTAEIGRRMSVSKNAVVGKAHRLNLPARPSPIRRDGAPRAPRTTAPRRIVGPTLPPLSASLPPEPIRGMPPPLHPGVEAPDALRPLVAPPARQASEAAAMVTRSVPARAIAARITRPAACCWPIGEPGTREFHFCDGEAMPGKPYCAEHAQIAYVKVRDRREEAA